MILLLLSEEQPLFEAPEVRLEEAPEQFGKRCLFIVPYADGSCK
jgi:hypothetical protein